MVYLKADAPRTAGRVYVGKAGDSPFILGSSSSSLKREVHGLNRWEGYLLERVMGGFSFVRHIGRRGGKKGRGV